MNVIQTVPAHEMTPELGAAIIALTRFIWPPDVGAKPPGVEATLEKWRAEPTTHFVIAGEDSRTILAHAMLFRREIFTLSGALSVGALAAVCVNPDYRGRSWGVAVARAAFDFLPELGVEVSLFQTPVPHFYEKLGCRVVNNSFYNGNDPANPFWDACEMIYPAAFTWPRGEINMNGPGY